MHCRQRRGTPSRANAAAHDLYSGFGVRTLVLPTKEESLKSTGCPAFSADIVCMLCRLCHPYIRSAFYDALLSVVLYSMIDIKSQRWSRHLGGDAAVDGITPGSCCN